MLLLSGITTSSAFALNYAPEINHYTFLINGPSLGILNVKHVNRLAIYYRNGWKYFQPV